MTIPHAAAFKLILVKEFDQGHDFVVNLEGVTRIDLSALQLVTYRIRFKPNPQIFSNGTNPIPLLEEHCEPVPCKVVAHIEAIPEIEAMDPEVCCTSCDVILTTQEASTKSGTFLFLSRMMRKSRSTPLTYEMTLITRQTERNWEPSS